MAGSYGCGNETLGSINCGEFFFLTSCVSVSFSTCGNLVTSGGSCKCDLVCLCGDVGNTERAGMYEHK